MRKTMNPEIGNGEVTYRKMERNSAPKIGLTLPISSLRKMEDIHLASSILLNPVSISFADFVIISLNSTKFKKREDYATYPLEKTIFYPFKIPITLKQELIDSYIPKGMPFNEFVKMTLVRCINRYEGYNILTYIWVIKLIKAIMGHDMTHEEGLKLFYEGSFPGPKELYDSLKDIFEHFHPGWDEEIDLGNLKKIRIILEKYHEERKISHEGYPQDSVAIYYEEFLSHILRTFLEYLLAFPVLLGDVPSQDMPDFKSESVLNSWYRVMDWGGGILSSTTQLAMYHYYPPNSKDSSNGISWKEIKWNEPTNTYIHQTVLDILKSIVFQKMKSDIARAVNKT